MTATTEVFMPRTECLFEHCAYSEHYPMANKTIWMRPVDVHFDLSVIHRWMNLPHVEKFWEKAWPIEKIREYLVECKERTGFDPHIVYMDEEPFGYIEIYDPAHDRMKEYYDVEPHDQGLHILIGEEKYLKRFIIRLSLSVIRFTFLHRPGTRRIIGEPDERNRQVLGLMRYVGFRPVRKLELPEKVAEFMILRREEYEQAHGKIQASAHAG